MRKSISVLFCCFCFYFYSQSQTIVFHEGFNNITQLLSDDWVRQNNSQPVGPYTWRQGDSLILDKNAYIGCDSCYLMNDWQATDVVGNGDISDWFITPELSLQNGDTVELYTISYNNEVYPDRLEVRFSPNGNSTDVGLSVTDVGDFTNLIFSVNPLLDTVSYPMWNWARVYGVVNGLSGTVPGRLALRYYVTNGGGTGSNSSTIGVDELKVIRPTPSFIQTETKLAFKYWPNPANDELNLLFENAALRSITLYNALGETIEHCSTSNILWKLNTSALKNNFYYLQVNDMDHQQVEMIRFLKMD